MTSFLQSNEWVEFQRSLGREVLEYSSSTSLGDPKLVLDKKDGVSAKVIRHDLPFRKNYLYIPHGPIMDFNQMIGGLKNPVANFIRWLREEAKKRRSIFVKAEPLVDSVAQVLVEAGFRKSKKEIQPSKTVIIDLTKSGDELLSAMHHKTRYNIGVADKHNVVVAESDDIEQFLKLLKKTAKRDKFHAHPADYYRKLINFPDLEIKLYFAKQGEKLVAAALVLIYGDTGYYLHGASDYEHRSLMAPYALHWYIIKQLQTTNYKLQTKYYDLWGIEPRRWPGVTRFKLGWGGRIVEYPGAFDLTISKFWHLVYKLVSRK